MARIALVHDIAGVAAVQAKLLREAGHDVDQIALPTLGASWRWPMKAAALPVRVVGYLPTAWKLRRGRYDVIHIHFLSQGVVGVLAGRPFLVQAHGSDVHANLKNPVYRWVTRVVLNKARTVFYVTPNLPALLAGYENKLVYLPNPVDVTALAQEREPPTEVRRVVIFTRLHPVKGVDQIFPAVEELSSMVSVTAFDSGPLANEYGRRYGRWVDFVKPLPHGQIADFLRRFDVVIGQMRQGVLGLMEIEAMAAGRPLVVAVDATLYLDDPPPVVFASDPAGIVTAIKALKTDALELRKLSEEGRAWSLRHHSLEGHLRRLEDAYFGARRAT